MFVEYMEKANSKFVSIWLVNIWKNTNNYQESTVTQLIKSYNKVWAKDKQVKVFQPNDFPKSNCKLQPTNNNKQQQHLQHLQHLQTIYHAVDLSAIWTESEKIQTSDDLRMFIIIIVGNYIIWFQTERPEYRTYLNISHLNTDHLWNMTKLSTLNTGP